jgi:hypothetical protein
MRSQEVISEIEIISSQDFPKGTVARLLPKANQTGFLDEFTINYVESGDQRVIILTDSMGEVAAYAGFIVRLSGKIWQAANAMTYEPYRGKSLVAKIYRMIKQQFRVSIQSDKRQTLSAVKLWTKTLPALGLRPMIFDTETNAIIDPSANNIDLNAINDEDRYTWILERFDRYPEQNLLSEHSILMPYRGIWYDFKREQQ